MYILSEIYEHDRDTGELIAIAQKRGLSKQHVMYCDSAEPDRIKTWREAGYRASAPLSTAKIVSVEVREWLASERRAEMIAAEQYYANKNDITQKKRMVDEYDRTVSDNANLLEDEPNGILVVRNYDGQKLDEFRRNLAQYRAVKVTEDGGIESLATAPNIAATTTHLETLKSNIYAFGRGVDNNAAMGANASAEARQFLYAQLDLDCNQLEQGIQSALQDLMFFLGIDEKVAFTLNRDIIISELSAIEMCVKSQGVAGLSNHPWVKDSAAEGI